MGDPNRNVRKTYDAGKFWLFDNEFAFYQGYVYSYSQSSIPKYTKWFWIHEELLKALCIFRRSTILKIQMMAEMQDPAEYFLKYVRQKEPLYHLFENRNDVKPIKKIIFKSRFHERLKFLMSWVEYCKKI